MAASVTQGLLTTADLLAIPDDGVRRWLIRGQLREERPDQPGEPAMTVRNRWHSRVMARVTKLLDNWLDQQPAPRGSVLCGEVGVRLQRDPDSTVGVDVIYISPELAAHAPDDTNLVDGVPVLAVEILSPRTFQEELDEKIDLYLRNGVPLVWVISPHRRTVLIYRAGEEPELVNVRQELSGEPHLPGFRVAVAQLFT